MKLLATLRSGVQRAISSPDLRNSFIYIAASTFGYGIVFLQNFSLAYFLSIDFFGQITLIISLFSTFYVLFTFGMNAVVQRFYFDKYFNREKKALLSHVATLWLGLGVCLCVVLMIIGYQAFKIHALFKLDYHREFLPILFGAFLFSFTEIFPNFFIVREKPTYYALWLIMSRGTIFIILHAVVFISGESSVHISQGLLFAGAGLAVAGVIAFRIFPLQALQKTQLKDILVYSLPLMIYALGGIGYSHGYRVIISNWLTFEDLAIFSLTNQIALVYYLTAASCITGLYPKAYKALEEHNGSRSAIRFYFKLLIVIGVGLMIVIGPAGYFFLHHFKGGAFENGLKIFPMLLAGQFIFFLYSYNYVLCTFYKKTQIITYSMLAGVFTSLCMAYLLLQKFSLLGAAIPIISGVIVQFIISFISVNAVARRTATGKEIQLPG